MEALIFFFTRAVLTGCLAVLLYVISSGNKDFSDKGLF